MNDTSKLAAIDAITAEIPAFECVPGCTDCCGSVLMSRLEWHRVLRVMTPPDGTPAKTKRTLTEKANALASAGSLACPMLAGDKCGCYGARPTICRMFGAVDEPRLTCPHGRAPAVKLTKEQGAAVLRRVEELGK